MLPDVFLQGELSGAFNFRGFLKNAGERIKALARFSFTKSYAFLAR